MLSSAFKIDEIWLGVVVDEEFGVEAGDVNGSTSKALREGGSERRERDRMLGS